MTQIDETQPEVTHRPLNSEAFDLDQLAPAERERVEKIMADIEADLTRMMDERFIGQGGSDDQLMGYAQAWVDSWNQHGDQLRDLAERMTGNPVESCVMVLDGVDGTNILTSFQTEFARRGTERYKAWAEAKDVDFAAAREVALKVLEEELPEDGLEPRTELTTEQMGAGIASIIQDVLDGTVPPGEATKKIETVDGVVEVTTYSSDSDPED